MKILFASDNLYLPQLRGGTEVSISTLCYHFKKENHNVSVSCGLGKKGTTYFKNRLLEKLFQGKINLDTVQGCRVYRDWSYENAAERAILDFEPDLVFLMKNSLPLMKLFNKHKIPLLLYLRDVYFKDLQFSGLDLSLVRFIANSEFTRSAFLERFALDSLVVPPLIDKLKYKTNSVGENVLFINPNKMKGVDIALQLFQRNPQIQFLMLESWPLTEQYREKLAQCLEPLENVIWMKPQKDMRKVYAQVKLILVPSQCEESWGRVASEAQVSGIPVIASKRGGLIESVGSGGILIDEYKSIDKWDAVLNEVWGNRKLYESLRKKAFENALKKDEQEEVNLKKLLEYAIQFDRKA